MRKLEIIYLGASVKGAQILVPVDARKYSFLTSNMVVRKGDVILSFERKPPMFVVSIEEDYRSSSITVDGKPIPLTVLHLNRTDDDKVKWAVTSMEVPSKRFNIEETRAFKLSLKEARQWYRGSDPSLRRIALTMYTEQKLELSIEEVLSCIEKRVITVTVPASEAIKSEALSKWASLAKFFNGSWKMKAGKTGHFLGRQCYPFEGGPFLGGCGLPNFIKVCEHSTVMYPGIVYFKNKEDILKAANLMKDSLAAMFD